MLQGLNTNERIEFVSKYDLTEPKTVFVLKPLSGYESTSINNLFESLMLVIVDIRNIPEQTSKEDYIKSLDQQSFTELVMKINSLNKVTENEKKN